MGSDQIIRRLHSLIWMLGVGVTWAGVIASARRG